MTTVGTAGPRRRPHRAAHAALWFTLFALALGATHAGMLRLPLHWDELGHFVPAALDLYREGAWVPRSVPPNVHPPGLAAYLAGVWTVVGYSLEATRAAMLAMAALALLAAFLLAKQLAGAKQAPLAAALLLVSPVFSAQAAMAQLDLPAALFTSLALWWFLRERLVQAALACAALVMTKETGIVAPLVFAAWLAWEGRRREAALFLLPALPLAAWLAALAYSSGHLLGNTEFAEYNALYPLHPVRLAGALLRRLHYLFLADFHWVGTAAMAVAWRRGLFEERGWRVAGTFAAAHAAAVTLLGGAVLERYLLPALPVLYSAMAASAMALKGRTRAAVAAALMVGLSAGNFLDPPYPNPPENNLAWTDYVRLHREAAAFAAARYGNVPVATAWPLSNALAFPEAGYVRRPLATEELPDLQLATLKEVDWEKTPVLLLFSQLPEHQSRLQRSETVRRLWRRYWRWAPEATPAELRRQVPLLKPVARWSRRGQWVEVYERKGRFPAP